MNKRKSFVIALIAALLFSSSTMFMGNVKAEGTSPLLEYIYNKPSNEFQFNHYMLLDLYTDNSTGRDTYGDYRHAMKELSNGKLVAKDGEVLVPIYTYQPTGERKETLNSNDQLQDGRIQASDSAWIKIFSQVNSEGFFSEYTASESYTDWWDAAEDVIFSLVDYLKAKGISISADDITLSAYVYQKAIEGYSNSSNIEYTITNKAEMTNATFNKIKQMIQVNQDVKASEYSAAEDIVGQEYVTVTATTNSGQEYRLVLGQDNNWYLLTEAEPTVSKIIINYITNGGAELDPITFTITNPDDLNQDVTLETTTREGYKFVGWFEEEKLKNEVDLSNLEDVFNLVDINDDAEVYEVNVYAKWSNTTENPKTGISSLYISGGVIIAAAGLYALARKKNLYKKI